ncbi:MAG: hypothetical protein KY437_11090 [Actinobacteria bacterium]|nr:hypothetical protein [Actinomycetota bacterium]
MTPHSWDVQTWRRFTGDIDALDGSSDVRLRRRGVLLRLLALGVPVAAIETLLPGWDVYLEPSAGASDRQPEMSG